MTSRRKREGRPRSGPAPQQNTITARNGKADATSVHALAPLLRALNVRLARQAARVKRAEERADDLAERVTALEQDRRGSFEIPASCDCQPRLVYSNIGVALVHDPACDQEPIR